MSLAPNRKLLNHSALVNVHGYIERIIHIGKLKDKTHEVKYGEQKGLCNICKKPLLDWEEKIAESENSSVDVNSTALRKRDMLFGNEELDLQAKWYKGLDIDHLVPKGIGVLFDLRKTLEGRSNKQLLHRNCHKTKYASDKKFVSKFKEDYSIVLRTNALERIKAVPYGDQEDPTSSELDTAKTKALIEVIGRIDNEAIIRQRSEHTWNKIQNLLKKKKAEFNIVE